MSRVKDLLDAVAQLINDASLDLTFTAAGSVLLEPYDQSQTDDLRVSVVPMQADASEFQRLGRSDFLQPVEAAVIVEQRVGTDAGRVDALIDLEERIAAHLLKSPPSGYRTPTVSLYPVDLSSLSEAGQFAGYVHARYPSNTPAQT